MISPPTKICMACGIVIDMDALDTLDAYTTYRPVSRQYVLSDV